ncbi:MAG: PIG-L family deacetylase [Candidatus Latescibacter sp.]|nr:PIG-L family deacetylase [Candidatus Latescibacter sp.]
MNIIVFGAHPDDCELQAGGTAIKWVRAGHRVKFVSVTNGDAGHQDHTRKELARIRKAEAAAADAVLGVTSEVLNNPDGELLPTLEVRFNLIRLIRKWDADMVITHRHNDYHPDHRNTGLLVQDTAYMVIVPKVCPDTPPLKKNPVYLYTSDRFKSPEPFRPDVIVPIDDVFIQKICALHCMPSQFYEWLPWTGGNLDKVPKTDEERRASLEKSRRTEMPGSMRTAAEKMYGKEAADLIKLVEAFQVCEYGRQPSRAELQKLFPFLPPFR